MLIYYRGETRTIRAVLRGDDGAPLADATGVTGELRLRLPDRCHVIAGEIEAVTVTDGPGVALAVRLTPDTMADVPERAAAYPGSLWLQSAGSWQRAGALAIRVEGGC